MTLDEFAIYASRVARAFYPLLMLAIWVMIGYACFRGVRQMLRR
jgi:hypothetical protein